MADKPIAHIENWSEEPLYGGGTCLVGTITKHDRQSEFHTRTQQTSRIVSINREGRIASTENTLYSLGKEIPNV